MGADDLGMLTAIGLTLNFVGAIVLLGSDVERVEHVLKRIDPVHHAYKSGLIRIIDESMVEGIEDDNRVYPYDRPVCADHWSLWPIRQFLRYQVGQDIPRDAEIDIRGGWFKVNGEELTFPEKRTVQVSDGQLRTQKLTLSSISALLYEARVRRIYIYGVCLLALGFLLQLIDSLGALAAVPLYA